MNFEVVAEIIDPFWETYLLVVQNCWWQLFSGHRKHPPKPAFKTFHPLHLSSSPFCFINNSIRGERTLSLISNGIEEAFSFMPRYLKWFHREHFSSSKYAFFFFFMCMLMLSLLDQVQVFIFFASLNFVLFRLNMCMHVYPFEPSACFLDSWLWVACLTRFLL